jgi:hypothetical protein
VLPDEATSVVALVYDMFITGQRLVDHSFNSAVFLTDLHCGIGWPLSHHVLIVNVSLFLEITIANSFLSIRSDHWGVVGTGLLFNLLVVCFLTV